MRNNGGHVRPPAGSINYNITVQIPKHTSGDDSTCTNFGIATLVEIWNGHDAKVTVTPGADTNLVGVVGVSVNTQVSIFT